MNSALIQVIGVTGIELATVNKTIGMVGGPNEVIRCINDFTVVLADAQGDLSLYPICSLSGFRVDTTTPVAIPTGCNIRNTCSRCANTVKNSLCNLKTFIPTTPIDIDVEGSGFTLDKCDYRDCWAICSKRNSCWKEICSWYVLYRSNKRYSSILYRCMLYRRKCIKAILL